MDWNTLLDEFPGCRIIYMIAVDMGNQNSAEVRNTQTQLLQPPRDVSLTEPTIDKNCGAGIPYERGIASTRTAENAR